MLKNYLKTFWKVARQNKLFTFLSLFGISLTIMFVMIFSMTVNKVVKGSGPEKDLSNILFADKWKVKSLEHKDHSNFSEIDRRLCEDHFKKIESAEIVSMYFDYYWEFIQNGKHYSKGFMTTDAEFWEVFSFTFIQGRPYSPREVQDKSTFAVITESLKDILFGNELNVLGKTMKFYNWEFTVIGIVEDVPPTSQNLSSGLFIPYTIIPYEPNSLWPYLGSFSLAFKAEKKKQFPAIRKEVQDIVDRIDSSDPKWTFFLAGPNTQMQNLLAVYDPEQLDGPKAKLKKYLLWGFGFILLPAINLMALNFARIRERGEEIAIRKSFGASSAVLRGQFLIENVIMTLLGSVFGVLLSFLTVAFLGDVLTIPIKRGTTVPMSFSFDFTVFGIALGVCLLFAMLSGVLPAIRMSKMKPVKYLKGGEL